MWIQMRSYAFLDTGTRSGQASLGAPHPSSSLKSQAGEALSPPGLGVGVGGVLEAPAALEP